MEAVTLPRRELTILAVALVAASRLVDGLPGGLVVGCIFAAILLGTRRLLGSVPARLAVVPLILPATAAAGGAAAIHVLAFDLWLPVGLAGVAILVDRSLALEEALEKPATIDRTHPPLATSRGSELAEVLGLGLLVAFVAFVGVGALVPDGLAAAPANGGSIPPLAAGWLAVLALGDAAVAGLVGLRLSGIRSGDVRDVAWSAATYATIAGVAAAALRALAIPRFLGPALLTLLVYLWSAYRGSTRATRRSARWLWESALLAILAIVVVAWNIAIRP